MAKIIGSKYELEYVPAKKMFFIKVWGFYLPEDAMSFMKDYDAETKKFNANDTALVIDCDGLVTSKPETKVLLGECMKLYMSLPYKHRIFIKSKSPTCNMWLKSSMVEGNMVYGKDGIIIDDMNAVLEYIK